jgi:transcriptional regulator with XRE-family HTH domain
MISGERVEALMLEQGLTQAELARRAGVSQPSIFKLIRENKTGSRILPRVARILRTTPAYLTCETDDKQSDSPDEAPLSSDEQELLDNYRAIEPKERAAILTLARSLATNARSPTVHERGQDFRSGR